MFRRTLGVTGTLLLILFVALPFVAGSAEMPADVTAHAIGTSLHQFVVYWSEVVSII